MYIRELAIGDKENGFFETLESLSSCEGLTIGDAERLFKDILNDKKYHIYVAIIDEEIVGTATVFIEQKFIHNGGKVAHIEDVVTRKNYKRKGVGAALVKKLIEVAKEQGCYKVILNCSVNNKLFYSKLGFAEHGIEMRMNL